MSTTLFWPMFAQVVLTTVVWVCMYRVRVAELRERQIHPQMLALSGPKSEVLQNTKVADNFSNLFEVPVLFFAACLVGFGGGVESIALLALAWTFVGLRALHSLIQTTYNKVMHRFAVYVLSTAVVLAMWGLLAVEYL